MAAVQRTDATSKMLAFALLLFASLIFAGVKADEEEVVTKMSLLLSRGDNIPKTTKAPVSEHNDQGQAVVLPTMDLIHTNETSTVDKQTAEVSTTTHTPTTVAQKTRAPLPARGDGPSNKPKDDVVCVSKEAVQNKNAVSLKLKSFSNCKDTKAKIQSVLLELCGEDCKLEIYQEDNSNVGLVSGKYVQDDVIEMTNKFNNDNIKDKTDIEEAVPHWGKNSKLILVSLLLAGLLLAALLTAGYYLKTHRKNSKGVRLAESFQVDEENQANTLVSVAPLPQEPIDKPTVNGESPPENGTNPAPTTNGHSQTQTPVADTEM